MFYEPKKGYPLLHNPFNALVFPRPIGWISSLSKTGIANLAPYSFYNAIAYVPPQVMFSATAYHNQGGFKDSVANILTTKEFVVNLATKKLKNQVNMIRIPQIITKQNLLLINHKLPNFRNLISNNKALPLNSRQNIAFDQIEIFQRKQNQVVESKVCSIKEIKKLDKEILLEIEKDIKNITLEKQSILGLKFEVISSDFDESTVEFKISPQDFCESLAYNKAKVVADKNPNKFVIGADTIVFCNNKSSFVVVVRLFIS